MVAGSAATKAAKAAAPAAFAGETDRAPGTVVPRSRAAKAAPAVFAEPEPRLAEPEQRMVNGLRVVKDEPAPSPLSTANKQVFFKGRRVLTLEDGSTIGGCADCEETGTRGELNKHRIEKHGAGKSGTRTKSADTAPTENVLGMTVGEILTLAAQIDGWEDVATAITEDRDGWKSRATAAETELRKIHRALERVGFVLKLED